MLPIKRCEGGFASTSKTCTTRAASEIGLRRWTRLVKSSAENSFVHLRGEFGHARHGAGEPVHVVAARLGHVNANTMLAVYAHALPSQGRSAAARLGVLGTGN